jgi:hypothetical protein
VHSFLPFFFFGLVGYYRAIFLTDDQRSAGARNERAVLQLRAWHLSKRKNVAALQSDLRTA